jgi:hypothetical protein
LGAQVGLRRELRAEAAIAVWFASLADLGEGGT